VVEWMKIHKKLSILVIIVLLLLVVLIIPFFLNWIYYLNAPWEFFKLGYELPHLLSYYGAVLTFLGTVSLGIITVYQNYMSQQKTDEINKLTLELQKKSMAMAEQRYEKEQLNEIKYNAPKLELKNRGSNGHYMNLQAELTNVSNLIVSGIKSISFTVSDETNAIVLTSEKVKVKETSLTPGTSTIIQFHNDQLKSENSLKKYKITWDFQCEDQYGNTHYLKANVHIEDSGNFIKSTWKVQKVG